MKEECEEALTDKFLKAEVLRLSNVAKQHSEDIGDLPEESDEDTNALTIKVGSLMQRRSQPHTNGGGGGV